MRARHVGSAVRLPESIPFETAAAFRANYATALLGMQRARLQPGDVLLVHGAGGGVGLAAVDVGKLMGATVIGTAATREKRDVVSKLGADHTIDYTTGFRERVKELTGGRGADVIFDPIGGPVFDESMRCIAPMGRILIVGFAGGNGAGLAKTNHLLVKDAEVIGFTVGALSRHDPERAQRNVATLLTWLAADRIRPHISHRLPLEQTAEGCWRDADNRKRNGVDRQGLVEHIHRATELRAPQVVTDDGDAIAVRYLVLIGPEKPPVGGL